MAKVRKLSYFTETRASASPYCPKLAVQHALIVRKTRKSKNWNLAVIAMSKKKKNQLRLLLYLERLGSHRIHSDMVNKQTGNSEKSNLG